MPADDPHERLKYIDSLLYWRKSFTSKNLQDHFSVTRQTVNRDLKEYEGLFPQNTPHVEVVDRQHFYHTSSTYQPELAEKSFSRFLQQSFSSNPNFIPAFCAGRRQEPSIVGPLLFAIENGLRFESRYFSVSSGDTEQRVIQPHAIAEACGRYHVRAWCEKSQRYSDFVLARFDEYAELNGPADPEKGADNDSDWNTMLHITVIPDPRLSSNRRKAVEMEYAMRDGRLELTSRLALLNYLLKDLRIDRYQENPNAQQVILEPECREQIEKHLWR